MSNKNLLVSVSGGRSSAMMAHHIHYSPKYKDFNKLYVFCNTGQERIETIEFLKKIKRIWKIPLNLIEGVYSTVNRQGVRHKIVDFDNLSMNSEPFEGAIMQATKHTVDKVPNVSMPYCSKFLKKLPAHSFAKSVFGTHEYTTALGFRAEDMPKRITLGALKEKPDIIAPLLTDFKTPITQLDLNVFYENQPFKLGIHSRLGNCQLCFKKSDRNIIESLQYGSNAVDWYRRMEKQYNSTFFRNYRTIDDFVKLAEIEQLSMFDDTLGDACDCGI